MDIFLSAVVSGLVAVVAAIVGAIAGSLVHDYRVREAARRKLEEDLMRQHISPSLKAIEGQIPQLVKHWARYVDGYQPDIPYEGLTGIDKMLDEATEMPITVPMALAVQSSEILHRSRSLAEAGIHPRTLLRLNRLATVLSVFGYVDFGEKRIRVTARSREGQPDTIRAVLELLSMTDEDLRDLPNLVARLNAEIQRNVSLLSNRLSWEGQIWKVFHGWQVVTIELTDKLFRRKARVSDRWEPARPIAAPEMFYLAKECEMSLKSRLSRPSQERLGLMIEEGRRNERPDESFFAALDQQARKDNTFLPARNRYMSELVGRTIRVIHPQDEYAYDDALTYVVEGAQDNRVSLGGQWGELIDVHWYIEAASIARIF